MVLALPLAACVSPLIKAAGEGDMAGASVALDHGANINAPSNGMTPLTAASAKGRNEMIAYLLKRGAEIDKRADGGWTPLFTAIYSNKVETAKLLVDSGAEVSPAMLEAAKSYAPDLVPFLVENQKASRMTRTQLQNAMTAAMARVDKSRDVPKSDVDQPVYHLPERLRDYAIVVGIEKYANPDIPPAQFAEHDAEAVRAHLIGLGVPPRNIKFLSGARATKSELTAYLEQWLPMNAVKGGRVYFYFSGHGAPAVESQEAYLVPVDGDPEFLPETAYPMKRLYVKLNNLPADRVVIVLDTCFSGAGGRSLLAKGTRPLITKTDDWLLGSGHVIAVSASKSDQASGVSEEQGHGLFTYYLLKGLNGDATEGNHVTVSGLYQYLRAKVSDAASNQNRSQTPEMVPAEAPDMGLR